MTMHLPGLRACCTSGWLWGYNKFLTFRQIRTPQVCGSVREAGRRGPMADDTSRHSPHTEECR